MPIRKPVQTVIRADDFRDKAYRFTVESVSGPGANPDAVVVSASAGYLLTTSRTNQPNREQVLNYTRQSDGSWLVNSVVALVFTGEIPVNGAVVIQASETERIILTVDVTVASLDPLPPPALTVNRSTLTFAATAPGKPSFQIVTLTRQPFDAPVTLTTDAPDHFQLATDSQPTFVPALTLIPSPAGTHVHVRYAADRRGSHVGQLTVQSVHETMTIPLKGRSAGLFPVVSGLPRPSRLNQWAGLFALLLVGVLGWVGYGNRCQLFPALCRNTTATNQAIGPARLPASASTSTAADAGYAKKEVIRSEKRLVTVQKPLDPPPRRQPSIDKPADRAVAPPTAPGIDRQRSVAGSRNASARLTPRRTPVGPRIDRQPRQRIPPATEESDLERELNQPAQNP